MGNIKNFEDYSRKIRAAESSGNDNARNVHGATGRYQFLPSTWTGLGFDIKDIYNPEMQEKAMAKFTAQNADYLRRKLKIEPTDADLYGAHFLGAAGYTNLYKTSNDRPISDVMSPKEINDNPFLKGKTVGYLKNYLKNKTSSEPSQYQGSRESNYYIDSTVNLKQGSGDYDTASEYEEPEEDQDEVEGNEAKQELLQAQQEKNFLQELQAQQEQQQTQYQQNDPSAYELYVPELPELQTPETPSYF